MRRGEWLISLVLLGFLVGLFAGVAIGEKRCRKLQLAKEVWDRELSTAPTANNMVSLENVAILPVPKWDYRTMWVSAYCPCRSCCGVADGITASGHLVTDHDGVFVAAPVEIPFGTALNIPGYSEVAPVYDRGGSISGDRLDVFFADDPGKPGSGHEKALNWGVQVLDVGFPVEGDPNH